MTTANTDMLSDEDGLVIVRLITNSFLNRFHNLLTLMLFQTCMTNLFFSVEHRLIYCDVIVLFFTLLVLESTSPHSLSEKSSMNILLNFSICVPQKKVCRRDLEQLEGEWLIVLKDNTLMWMSNKGRCLILSHKSFNNFQIPKHQWRITVMKMNLQLKILMGIRDDYTM